MIGVWVEYCYGGTEVWNDRFVYSPGWRISWTDDEGISCSLSECFVRKSDAEAALAYMEKHGLTRRDFANSPHDGTWEWKKKMLEALQW